MSQRHTLRVETQRTAPQEIPTYLNDHLKHRHGVQWDEAVNLEHLSSLFVQ